MCGLTGEYRLDGNSADIESVARMRAAMEARGPDAEGLWHNGRVALAHRRLKIIDLSDASRQPMVDSDLGLTAVFNGAIYNYRELRGELEGLGYRFFSQGDTEVILKAWHAWGEQALQRLNGMFAFAIHQRDDDQLILARDRLGIKPLYYSRDTRRIRFASSLPAMLAGGDIDTEIDPVALHHYMHFHAVVPSPHTILQGVRKLAPASLVRIRDNGDWQEQRYWRAEFTADESDAKLSFDDWKDCTLTALRRSVERRLVADVPVGVLLSGGLDSSLITGLLHEAGQQNLKTFSVGFESVGDEIGDEFRYSDVIARHYGTDHHQIRVDSATLLPALGETVAAMSEPMVSHDAVGFYLLSREVAKHVKVVQSGQGADEVFAGYHWYPPMMDSRDPAADYAKVFCDRDQADFQAAVNPRFHAEDYSRQLIREHFGQAGAARAVDKALRIDTEIMLVDDPVKRVDNMTMAWGLEARVPFLDHELLELAAHIPAEHKVANGGKHVLKEAARQVIPAEVIDRPKGYFPVPALKYIRGDYLELMRDLLHAPAAQERQLFNAGYVQEILKAPEAHITPLRGAKLWQLALLEYWLQTHVDAAVTTPMSHARQAA